MNVGTVGRADVRQISHLHRDPVRGWSRGGVSWTRSPTVAASVLTGVVTLALRLAYAASGPTDVDGAQYVIGAGRFDVTHDAPRAPGSWLYVAVGHAVHVVTGLSAVHGLVVVSALASAGAAALTCAAGAAMGGRWVGIAAGALVASAPVSWFAGATVSVAGFDAAVCAVLFVLARRARPYRAHGVAAAAVLGLGAGFHLAVVPEFALLALVVVVASVRTVGQLLATVAAAVAAVAVWFVPMILVQPGGPHAWLHAVHAQISAAHATSVFAVPAGRAADNLGTFGAWTLVTVGPAAAVGVLAVVVLAAVRVVTRRPAGDVSLRIWNTGAVPDDADGLPWYQGKGAIAVAALVPPVALVTLGHFAGGGDVLAYLVPLTVLVLLPVARLLHHRSPGVRRTVAVIATVLVGATVVLNVQRFVAAPGILPAGVARHDPGLWLAQARYQAPYTDTAAAVDAADRRDAQLSGLRALVDPAIDVIVCVSSPRADAVYRTIDEEIPDVTVALFAPFDYLEAGGLLYRHRATSLDVGPGGHAVVLVTSPAPVLSTLASDGLAVATHRTIAGLAVWRVAPGATLYGVTVRARSGRRPL